jgi:hypothetical protein
MGRAAATRGKIDGDAGKGDGDRESGLCGASRGASGLRGASEGQI